MGYSPSITERALAARKGCSSADELAPLKRAPVDHSKKRSVDFSLAEKQRKEIIKLARARHGPTLLDDENGRNFILAILHSIKGHNPEGVSERLIKQCGAIAPWAKTDWIHFLCRENEWRERQFNQHELAELLNVNWDERQKLKLTTIAAFDLSKPEFRARRKAQKQANDRKRAAAKRRANGAIIRREYEAKSTAKLKPWLAEGVSRATWYRRNKAK